MHLRNNSPLSTDFTSWALRKFSVRSAVAIVITSSPPYQALFIKRAIRKGDPWSGDIAFPGGKKQSEDKSSLETALRELKEETGLIPSDTTPIYRLNDRITRVHHKNLPMTISPWIFQTEAAEQVKLNHESTDFMWINLCDFTNPDYQSHLTWKTRFGDFTMPTVDIAEHRIWGLTLSMIRSMINTPELKTKFCGA